MHLGSQLSAEARASLAQWFARGFPAVVCRDDPGDEAGVALSVTLPASRWNATIRFTVGRAAVTRRAPPLPLAEAMLSAPRGWLAPLSDLERAAAGVERSALGDGGAGLAAHHRRALRGPPVAGGPPLPPPVARAARPDPHRAPGAGGLGRPPLVGEAVLGWDAAVAWRDLAHGRRRVLVRSAGSETVRDVERLLVGLR